MRRSMKAGLTLVVLISLNVWNVPAQQPPSLAILKEQMNQLERLVRSAEEASDKKASNLRLLTEKRAELRATIFRQIGSIRRYQSTYGYRFSARESKAVTDLIRSLEMELQGLDSRSNGAVAFSFGPEEPQERNHAQRSQPMLAFAGSAFLPQDDPTPEPSASPTPEDPRVEEAKKQKIIADAEKAKFDADKAAADARKAAADADAAATAAKLAAQRAKLGLGPAGADAKPAATPPSGNITAGTSPKFIETQLLAEMSARKASRQLVDKLCSSTSTVFAGKPIKKLIIHSTGDRASVETYKAVLAQLKFFHKEYERLLDQAAAAQLLPDESPKAGAPEHEFGASPLLLIPAATEAVKGFADLVNMFRTETEFDEQTVNVDARTIVTFLADGLLAKTAAPCQVTAIYYPSVYPVGIEANPENGEIMVAYSTVAQDVSSGDVTVAKNNEMIGELGKKAEALDATIADLKKQIADHKKVVAPAKSKGKKTEPDKPAFDLLKAQTDLAKAEADKPIVKAKIEALKRTAANIDDFKTSITAALKLMTTVENNQTVLTGLLRAERLKKILAEPTTYALDLVVSASGTNRIRRNAFFNAKIAHSGGVSIGAHLFNNQDELVFGRLEDYYIEFTSSDDIRKRAGFGRLDSTFTQ